MYVCACLCRMVSQLLAHHLSCSRRPLRRFESQVVGSLLLHVRRCDALSRRRLVPSVVSASMHVGRCGARESQSSRSRSVFSSTLVGRCGALSRCLLVRCLLSASVQGCFLHLWSLALRRVEALSPRSKSAFCICTSLFSASTLVGRCDALSRSLFVRNLSSASANMMWRCCTLRCSSSRVVVPCVQPMTQACTPSRPALGRY